ncbi:MAG TPA: hypothetical protein VFZ53_29535 [Polyangiaceae bacterium]
MAGCALDAETGESPGVHPDDLKPSDGAELEASDIGTAQARHTQHYVDQTNLWSEPGYPMGTDNPNCKNWWVYDRYLSLAPKVGTTTYTTYQTSHSWAKGATIDMWMGMIPTNLGYNTSSLIDHNSVVARSSGKCSGRYVFQWDNHDASGYSNFLANTYFVAAYIPTNLIPAATNTACNARAGTDIPYAWVDLYVCESPKGQNIGSFSAWCGTGSTNWRKISSATGYGAGYYNSYYKRCDATAGVYYTTPANKAAVSFNMVIKTGVGHGVAPATISISRYN